MKIFYHRGDLDGITSGALLLHHYPEAEAIGVDYDDDVQPYIDSIQPNETVFIVDFTFEPFNKMIEVYHKTRNLMWIDHHWSVIQEYHLRNKPFPAYVGGEDNKRSACYLVYEYLHPNKIVPHVIDLLSKYDTWQHDAEGVVVNFQRGVKPLISNVQDAVLRMNNLLYSTTDFVEECCDHGEIIGNYLKDDYANYAKNLSFKTTFDGRSAVVVNRGFSGSKIFDSIDKSDVDLLITFVLGPNQSWIIRLYTEKDGIDCGAICTKFGGGGHKRAAGFNTKSLDILGIR